MKTKITRATLAERNRARRATREEFARLLDVWGRDSQTIEIADLLQRAIESGHFPHLAFQYTGKGEEETTE